MKLHYVVMLANNNMNLVLSQVILSSKELSLIVNHVEKEDLKNIGIPIFKHLLTVPGAIHSPNEIIKI